MANEPDIDEIDPDDPQTSAARALKTLDESPDSLAERSMLEFIVDAVKAYPVDCSGKRYLLLAIEEWPPRRFVKSLLNVAIDNSSIRTGPALDDGWAMRHFLPRMREAYAGNELSMRQGAESRAGAMRKAEKLPKRNRRLMLGTSVLLAISGATTGSVAKNVPEARFWAAPASVAAFGGCAAASGAGFMQSFSLLVAAVIAKLNEKLEKELGLSVPAPEAEGQCR